MHWSHGTRTSQAFKLIEAYILHQECIISYYRVGMTFEFQVLLISVPHANIDENLWPDGDTAKIRILLKRIQG